MNMSGTMYKISCAKWGAWRAPLGVLLCFVAAVTAQPGFLSIDCGGKTDYTDGNNITWVSDADYIDHLGETADIGNVTIGNEYGALNSSLRFFAKPLNKSCYHLPVDPHVPYLLRLWFAVGTYNYSGFQQMPSFAVSFETMGTLYMRNITITDRDSTYSERILASSGTVLYICLIRTLESVDPFISAIELRKLQDGMYGHAKPGTILENIWRTDVGGGDLIIRYPHDNFDRIWTPHVPGNVSNLGIEREPIESTLINNTKDLPPPLVMQTAWLLNSSDPAHFSLGPFAGGGRKSLLFLYFAEIQMLHMSESRSFYVTVNGEKRSDIITLPRNYSAVELTILSNQTDDFQFSLVTASNSSLPPIVNAFEYYTVFDTQPATYLQDRNPYLSMPPNPKTKKLREHLVLGITLSGVLVIGLSLIAGIFLYRKKKECVTTESNLVENVVPFTSNEWTDVTIMVPNSAKACAFTLDQMKTATQNFSGKIGKGSFGSVFFGKLPEGKEIAVKVLSLFSTQGVHEFLNEIDVLSRVHHENLVTLLGYCNECKTLMIIYEHMSGGSLRDRLYCPNAGSKLNWKTRVKIALDAAQGLEYMHVVCTPKIIHRDVKTANILLDNNLKGKLGDFGFSRIWVDGEASHVTTMVKGTAGYLDPVYFRTQRLTDKSDVYSFGVVLLELICGRQPIDTKLSVDKLDIIQWATPFVEMDAIPGKIEEIIDKRLGGNYNIKSLTRVAKVAIRCVQTESLCRPGVSEVVAELREAIKLEETYNNISNVIP